MGGCAGSVAADKAACGAQQIAQRSGVGANRVAEQLQTECEGVETASAADATGTKVRETLSWPRSWANCSL